MSAAHMSHELERPLDPPRCQAILRRQPLRKPGWTPKIAQVRLGRWPDGCSRRGKGLAQARSEGTIMVKRPRRSRTKVHPENIG